MAKRKFFNSTERYSAEYLKLVAERQHKKELKAKLLKKDRLYLEKFQPTKFPKRRNG